MGIILTAEQRDFVLERTSRIPLASISTALILDGYVIPFLARDEIDTQDIADKHQLQIREMAVNFIVEQLRARDDYKTSELVVLETIQQTHIHTATSMLTSYIELVMQTLRIQELQKELAEESSTELDQELKDLTDE